MAESAPGLYEKACLELSRTCWDATEGFNQKSGSIGVTFKLCFLIQF